jgi:hypothetical protein
LSERPVSNINPIVGAVSSNADRSNCLQIFGEYADHSHRMRASGHTALSRAHAIVPTKRQNNKAANGTGVMFFLLRTAFWLSVVLALLPTGGSAPKSAEPSVSAIEAVSAAGAAMSDMSQFCGRQPEACVVGAQAVSAFGQRAQAGAKMVYEILSEKMGPAETGSVPAGKPNPAATKASQHTLTPADLQPAWRGPMPRKDPRDSKRPA